MLPAMATAIPHAEAGAIVMILVFQLVFLGLGGLGLVLFARRAIGALRDLRRLCAFAKEWASRVDQLVE